MKHGQGVVGGEVESVSLSLTTSIVLTATSVLGGIESDSRTQLIERDARGSTFAHQLRATQYSCLLLRPLEARM